MHAMIGVLVIALCGCLLMIGSVLFLPSVKIGKKTLSLYWFPVLLAAVLLLASGYLPLSTAWNGLTESSGVNPFKILVLFLSMTMLSVYLDEAGLFRYLAFLTLKKAGSSQIKLFIYLYCIVSVLTVFTSNDIVILTFTPFICYFAKHAEINPIPYLFAEFVGANTWSMLFIIGNPTNIYLATSAGIDFVGYLQVMWLPTLFAGLTAFGMLFLLFRRYLKHPISPSAEEYRPEEKPILIIGVVHLAGCTLLLTVASYLNLEMWYISLGFTLSLFVCVLIYRLVHRQKPVIILRTLKRAPWELIPFVLSMFILVLGLSENGVTDKIVSLFGERFVVWVYGGASTLFANIINNIPMSVLFGSMTKTLPVSLQSEGVYASIIGSNIGAFLTPIGALAGIMWSNILRKNQIQFSFAKFVLYGFTVALPTLVAALFGLSLLI